jgi:hypothetical protein
MSNTPDFNALVAGLAGCLVAGQGPAGYATLVASEVYAPADLNNLPRSVTRIPKDGSLERRENIRNGVHNFEVILSLPATGGPKVYEPLVGAYLAWLMGQYVAAAAALRAAGEWYVSRVDFTEYETALYEWSTGMAYPSIVATVAVQTIDTVHGS